MVLMQLGRSKMLPSSTLELGPLWRSSGMTITDSSTENHSMALQAFQTQQAQNITPHPTQNMPFHPCPPLSVDTNSPATQARDQVTLTSFLSPPPQPPTFQSGTWSSSQSRGEDRQGSKCTVLIGVWQASRKPRVPGSSKKVVREGCLEEVTPKLRLQAEQEWPGWGEE